MTKYRTQNKRNQFSKQLDDGCKLNKSQLLIVSTVLMFIGSFFDAVLTQNIIRNINVDDEQAKAARDSINNYNTTNPIKIPDLFKLNVDLNSIETNDVAITKQERLQRAIQDENYLKLIDILSQDPDILMDEIQELLDKLWNNYQDTMDTEQLLIEFYEGLKIVEGGLKNLEQHLIESMQSDEYLDENNIHPALL